MNEDWNSFAKALDACKKCGLGETRLNVVAGRGTSLDAPLMFIGEGPGEQEDIKGEAFVGKAGKLLDLLLEAQGFQFHQYYIANIVKCRPPDNRVPTDSEAQACLPWLRFQVKHIRPAIVVCLGSTAARYIVDKDIKITRSRGIWIEKPGFFSVLPTYHPSAVLRDPAKRKDFFTDIRKVRDKLIEMELWEGA